MLTYDAVIVGARPAGAATAMLLARAGARVLAVDWAEPDSDTVSTHALTRSAVTQLARWGIYGRLRAAGTPPIRRTTLHYGAEELPLDIRPDGVVEGLLTPRRTVLDPILANAAREAGAEVRHGTAFRDVLRDADGRVRGAILTARDGVAREVSAGIVIGADGRRSTVARRVGASLRRRSRHAAAHVYAYVPGLRDTGTHLHFGSGIGLGCMPTNAGLHCIVASVPPRRFREPARVATSAGGFRALVAEVAPELAADVDANGIVGRPIGFAGEHGTIRQSHGPGWALVGDAGYFKDPVTAHGITDALRDAELLAAAVLSGSDAALATYQQTRDAISHELFEITDEIASFGWTLGELKETHRRLNHALKCEQSWMSEAFGETRCAA